MSSPRRDPTAPPYYRTPSSLLTRPRPRQLELKSLTAKHFEVGAGHGFVGEVVAFLSEEREAGEEKEGWRPGKGRGGGIDVVSVRLEGI